jgi:transcriptional regulator with XRE-family HTH domain
MSVDQPKTCAAVVTYGRYTFKAMPSFGTILKRTREDRRVSIDDVARETRLSKRYLTALEAEEIVRLPGGTYNRSYLRTYATFLGLDAEPLLRLYAAEEARQLDAQVDLLATMNRTIDRRKHAPAGDTKSDAVRARPATIATVAVVSFLVIALAAGVVWYTRWPSTGTVEIEPAEQAMAATPATSAPDASPQETAASSGKEPPKNPARPSDRSREPVERVLQAINGGSHLSISGSGVGTAVVDRKLVGEADRFSAGSRVVFWTHVLGGRSGDTIDHVWLHDGAIVGAASLSVGSPDWRTQSRRVLSPSGDWVVEARDADGRVLARHEFRTADQ